MVVSTLLLNLCQNDWMFRNNNILIDYLYKKKILAINAIKNKAQQETSKSNQFLQKVTLRHSFQKRATRRLRLDILDLLLKYMY